jgi:hypothetical protein
LPPTFVDVGAVEVSRDEADLAPESAVAQACLAARESWLRRVLTRSS